MLQSMAPLPGAPKGAPLRRPIPGRPASPPQPARIPRQPMMAAAPRASPPPSGQASEATPSLNNTCLTWLPTLPSFVPNFSPHMSSDPNAMRAAIQEGSGIGPRPPGGFLSYFRDSSNYSLPEEIRHQPPMSGNFLYGGGPTPYAPFQASQTPAAQENSLQSTSEPVTTHSTPSLQTSPIVDVDNIDENGGSRTGRRMIWTPDESMRLVSAWLKNSIDPIGGNWKRNDQYWVAVTTMFNSMTPPSRKRGTKQLKEQWHRVNRSVNAFQSSWMKAERLRASGESDDQVMNKAMTFYEAHFQEGSFKLKACWQVLREQPKWHTHNEDLSGSNKRKNSEMQEAVYFTSYPDVVTDLPRPGGAKKAKDERSGKGKGKPSSSTMDEIDKLREGQVKSKEDRIEVLERHQIIATEKKESARLSFLAAQENKEAKLLEKEGKMHDKE